MSANRSIGLLRGSDALDQRVWVEWRYLDGELSAPNREMFSNRIEALGAMLSAVTEPDLRIPPCLGIFNDEDYATSPATPGQTRTGFTYSIPDQYDPMGNPITLRDIIANHKSAPLLGDRFKLVYTLAISLSLLHASNWLHKAFRSDNILFFHKKTKPRPPYPSIIEPYITGFEYARPYEAESIGYRPTGNDELDYYYHPAVVHGFSKVLDLYSFDVVLFEIAWWRPLNTKIIQIEELMTLENCRKVLLDNIDHLSSMMGEIYRDVVRTCLECDFAGDDEQLAHAVFTNIVRELGMCKA